MAGGLGNERHLRAGDKEPRPPGKDVLRVYGMKFCPRVHRVKLVLNAKGIKHETVNINIRRKPAWFLAKNVFGFVPVVEINGEILIESDLIAEYIDLAYEGKRKLIESDPLLRAKGKILLKELDTCGFYSTKRAKDEKARLEGIEIMKKSLKALETYLTQSGNAFISGDEPGMNDYMFWPFLEVTNVHYNNVVSEFQGVVSYVARMEENEAVKICRNDNQLWIQWHAQYFGNAPDSDLDFDMGTVIPAIQ